MNKHTRYNRSPKGLARYRRLRERRILAGLCDRCGKNPVSSRARVRCDDCLDAESRENSAAQIEKYTGLLERLEHEDPELMEQLGLTRRSHVGAP